MTTPKAFKDLEAFSDYPSGYEPVVETQQQLIVQSIKKSKHQRHLAVILAIAASVVILIIGDQPSAVSGQRTAVSGQRTAVSGQPTAVSGQRTAISGQLTADSRQPTVDSRNLTATSAQRSAVNGQTSDVSYQRSAVSGQPIADSGQPIADSRQRSADNRPPPTEIFLTKQRFKQFEFNRPPEAVKRPQEEKKKTEFFVFQNGNFKIINRPNQSQNTVIYTK